MSLTAKRILAGIYLVVLLFAAGNYFLDWGLTPDLDKKILVVVTFIGVLLVARYGSTMLQEIEEYRARRKRQRENDK